MLPCAERNKDYLEETHLSDLMTTWLSHMPALCINTGCSSFNTHGFTFEDILMGHTLVLYREHTSPLLEAQLHLNN